MINQWILVFRVDTCGWVNYNDLTILRNPGIMVDKGNHPQMAKLFRLLAGVRPAHGKMGGQTIQASEIL